MKFKLGDTDIPFVFRGDELMYPNPVKDGLVLWYDFSGRTNADGQRGIAEDLSGNGNHGTLRNFNYTTESGYDKNKLSFDGVDDFIDAPIEELNLDPDNMTAQIDNMIYSYKDGQVLRTKLNDARAELEGFEVGGRNLIENSDFSKGEHIGWGEESGLTGFNIVSGISYVGNYSLEATNRSGGDTNYSNYRRADPGESYSLSFYTLLTGENFSKASTFIRIVFLDEQRNELLGEQFQLSDLISLGMNEWHRVKIEGVVAPNNTRYVSAHIRWWSVVDNIYLDALQLENSNTSTPYSPAPEDAEAKITTIQEQNIQSYKLYNRALTEEEIIHNFNVEKERFSIE